MSLSSLKISILNPLENNSFGSSSDNLFLFIQSLYPLSYGSNNFGSFALPQEIILLSELPKTRSGKILRRVLRDLYLNPRRDKIGDLSTILNKNIINEVKTILISKRYK